MRNNSLTMNNAILFTISLALLLVGCGPQENADQLKEVNQNLERINSSLLNDYKIRIEVWKDRQKDPQTNYLAETWLPNINKIHLYADSLRMTIEDIKSELITQSDSLKREYVTLIRQLHDENEVGGKLFKNLAAFSDSIPALINPYESANRNYVPKDIPLLPGYADSLSARDRLQYEKNWLEKSFDRSSSLMAMIMLNKIENDVLQTEKILFEYCESTFCNIPVRYNQFKALAVLSSSYVKKGQPIEITAGVGGFTIAMKPRVTINDKEMKLDYNDGSAVHRFVADGKPGTHSVMVKIDFYKPDGSREYITKRLDYIIADEK
jgi:hypothetical protein